MCHQAYVWLDAHAVPRSVCVGVDGAGTLEAPWWRRPRLEQETALLWLLAHSNRSRCIHIWYASGHWGDAFTKKKKKKIHRCPQRKSGSGLKILCRWEKKVLSEIVLQMNPDVRSRPFKWNIWASSCWETHNRASVRWVCPLGPWLGGPSQPEMHLKSGSSHQERAPLVEPDQSATFSRDVLSCLILPVLVNVLQKLRVSISHLQRLNKHPVCL